MGGVEARRKAAPKGKPAGPPDLLERERELEIVDGALSAAQVGEGRLLYIEAQAGLGKSRLLRAAADRGAEAGAQVLLARASEIERNHSFGVAMQLLEPTVASATPEEREDLLGGAAALALPLFEDYGAATSSPDEQVFFLLHGLYWLVSNLAERRPLVIAADDAHWTDRASLRLFLYLAQRLADLPVVLGITARPAEPGAPEDLLRQLKDAPNVHLVRPAALTPDGVGAVVAARMPGAEEPFVQACATVTDGNPYLLNELLTDTLDRGLEPTAANAGEVGRLAPDSVLQAALIRLARLPTGTSALARAVAVLADEAHLRRAAELARLEEPVSGHALDAMVAAEILRPGVPLEFVHPLLHSAIYADIPPAERAKAHAHAAQMLARDGADGETVAAHLLATARSGDVWVVDQLRAAARRALAQGIADSAARYLTRALEEPPGPEARPDVLVELGEAESLAGRPDAAERLHKALELIKDPRRSAEVLAKLGWTRQKQGDLTGAVDAFERGVAELERLNGETQEPGTRAQLASLRVAHLGAAMLDPGRADQAQAAVATIAKRPASELSPGERGLLSVVAMHALFSGRDREQVIAFCKQAWGEGRLLEEEDSNSPTLWHVAGLLSWADELDLSEQVIEAALESARREGSIVTLALGFYSRSWPRYWRGDLAGAAVDAQAAVDAWSGEYTMYLPVAAYWLALTLLELDEVDRAGAAVELPDAEQRWGESNMYGPLQAGQGKVAMARGDPTTAVDLFEGAGNSVLGVVVTNPATIPWRSFLSEARLAAGDLDSAREAAAEEVRLTREFGAARSLGISLRAAGLAEGGERGAELLDEAVDVLRRSPAALELARALIDRGAAQRRRGRKVEARETLREGLDMSQQFGAVALERRASEELLAAGARPRRRELTGVHSLTPSELRVAEMAAEGMSNRDIAQSLFVTVNAVRFHLRKVYRKLDVSSREGLQDALRR